MVLLTLDDEEVEVANFCGRKKKNAFTLTIYIERRKLCIFKNVQHGSNKGGSDSQINASKSLLTDQSFNVYLSAYFWLIGFRFADF